MVELFHSYTFRVIDDAKPSGRYYIDLSDVLKREVIAYREGIPVVRGNTTWHNPVTVSFYALHLYGNCVGGPRTDCVKSFLQQARFICRTFKTQSYEYPTPLTRYGAPAHWRSGMAQGLAISVLERAFALTGDGGYRETALLCADGLVAPIEERGCASYDDDGYPFLEEVACNPPAHILNGSVFALWGLFDVESLTGAFSEIRLRALSRLAKELPTYDIGYWSRYDRARRGPASRGYHVLHIAQLEVLSRLTGNPVFGTYARKWRAYLSRPLCRLRAHAEKAREELRELLAEGHGKGS